MAFLLSFEGLRAFTGKNSPLVSLKNKASTPSVHRSTRLFCARWSVSMDEQIGAQPQFSLSVFEPNPFYCGARGMGSCCRWDRITLSLVFTHLTVDVTWTCNTIQSYIPTTVKADWYFWVKWPMWVPRLLLAFVYISKYSVNIVDAVMG